MAGSTLDAWLNSYCADGDPLRRAIAEAVRQIALAAQQLRKLVANGAEASHGQSRGHAHGGGDEQKELDVLADELYLEAARLAKVAHYASEERSEPLILNEAGLVGVAIDPLDGSSNIDTNLSIGTIFSILPALGDSTSTFLQSGRSQLAAGFLIFGPQLALCVTLGGGTSIFAFSSRLGAFIQSHETVLVTPEATEFAINASNYRHWEEAVRLYVDDCLQGVEGPRGKDFNMRWLASLVAEAYRILVRGGVFLYPRDSRKGYRNGRLRLVYEANPIAKLMEDAGALATDGQTPILDIQPVELHQRTPLVFGSTSEVRKIVRYHVEPSAIGARHPLFGHRGLFRS